MNTMIALAITASLLVAPKLPASGESQPSPEWLSTQRAIALAISQDPYLNGSEFAEQAFRDQAVAQSFRPDPRLTVSAANFPVDSFDFGQEPMTQLMLSVSQVLPRGDSLALRNQRELSQAAQQPLLREDRRASVTLAVTELWLSIYQAEQSITLIETDRGLFDQLVDAAELGYASGLMRSAQQDLIRAQLEVTAIEDRLTNLRQQRDSARQRLSEWVGPIAVDSELGPLSPSADPVSPNAPMLRSHPLLRATDAEIAALETDVDLARQSAKPEWMISAQYGLRGEAPDGRDRADFLSLGVSVDLPWFRRQRSDHQVSAAAGRAEAKRSDYALRLRQLSARWATAQSDLARIIERQALYERTLLPQMHELADAAINAYNNDEGEFAEAVRARIAELNAKIELLNIVVQRHRIHAQIAYLATSSEQNTGSEP
ncbi:MAG: TolC family protein [Xanthomonadales bacterium]|nr:TolC family protein [Xanthomonadales bacterium]